MTNKFQKYGFVVMLDALGIKNASMKEANTFLELSLSLKGRTPELIDLFGELLASQRKPIKKYEPKSKAFTFGDTLLLIWEAEKNNITLEHYIFLSFVLSFVMIEGIKQGFLFRGAVSIGEFIEKQNVILGPAVTDSASWYERADWFGIAGTPYFGNHYNASITNEESDNRSLDDHYKSFILYAVPLRDNKNYELYTVPWFRNRLFFDKSFGKLPALLWYYKQIQSLPTIPLGTEQKYKNTESYIDFLETTLFKK